MKKVVLALGAAAVLAFGALGTPAQAQQFPRGPHGVIVVQGPPPPRHYAPRHVAPRYYGPPPRHWQGRDDRRYRHYGRRDNDRDGVPNRYDSRPNNPYRR